MWPSWGKKTKKTKRLHVPLYSSFKSRTFKARLGGASKGRPICDFFRQRLHQRQPRQFENWEDLNFWRRSEMRWNLGFKHLCQVLKSEFCKGNGMGKFIMEPMEHHGTEALLKDRSLSGILGSSGVEQPDVWQDIVDTKLKVGESLKDSAEFILPDSFHERWALGPILKCDQQIGAVFQSFTGRCLCLGESSLCQLWFWHCQFHRWEGVLLRSLFIGSSGYAFVAADQGEEAFSDNQDVSWQRCRCSALSCARPAESSYQHSVCVSAAPLRCQSQCSSCFGIVPTKPLKLDQEMKTR